MLELRTVFIFASAQQYGILYFAGQIVVSTPFWDTKYVGIVFYKIYLLYYIFFTIVNINIFFFLTNKDIFP